MSYETGAKVRLVTNTLFVDKGSEGTIVEPAKDQMPPQLFPNRVCFPIGQDSRTVWCGTDELELADEPNDEKSRVLLDNVQWSPSAGHWVGTIVDDGGPETDNAVADGSRDYRSESRPEVGDATNTVTPGPCPYSGSEVCGAPLVVGPSPTEDYCTDECRAACSGPETAIWSDDWTWEPGELPSDFDLDVGRIFGDAQDLLLQKHKDYGPKNISQSPGGPLNGLRVRMWDKLARINNLVDNKVNPSNESLADSFKDLANYAIIGLMVLEGSWPAE